MVPQSAERESRSYPPEMCSSRNCTHWSKAMPGLLMMSSDAVVMQCEIDSEPQPPGCQTGNGIYNGLLLWFVKEAYSFLAEDIWFWG
jgi:hypothetical protein